jgi:DNA-binding NarL/FixJ family response regulator
MITSARVDDGFEIWVVEDKRIFRRALASLIDAAEDMRCPVAVESCEEAIAALEEGMTPDIVLMDIGLPGMDGIEGTRAIRSLSPTTRVIMLTVHEENEKIFEAICAGASGYLLKPSSTGQVVDAVRQVLAGAAPINAHIASKMLTMFARLAEPRSAADEYGLTKREREILQLLVEGLTIGQIADRLIVSYHTVDTHIRNIYAKLHVRKRGSAVAKAVQERLV